MTYSVRKLITEAYYLSNIVSREFQIIDGSQLALGFSLLNDFLALESTSTQNIPYYQEYNFTTVVGQEKYHVDNLLDIESMCFYLGNVRIPMIQKSRKEYFYSGRVEGLTVMPFSFRMERSLGGADLWMFPLSNIPYDVMAMVKYGLEEATSYDQDLSTIYDKFYLIYIRYGLTEMICQHEGVSVPPAVSAKLDNIRAELIETDYPDMRVSMISTLDPGTLRIV